MSGEAGEAPPPEAPPDETPPGDASGAEDGEHGLDTGKSTLRMDVSRKLSRKSTMYRAAAASLSQVRVDVDRTALEAILDVSSRLQDIQKKSKVSMSTLAFAHDSYKDKQVNKAVN